MEQNKKNVVFKAYFEWMIGIDPKNKGLGFNVTKMHMEWAWNLSQNLKRKGLENMENEIGLKQMLETSLR